MELFSFVGHQDWLIEDSLLCFLASGSVGSIQGWACSVNGSDVDLFKDKLGNKQQRISWYQNFKMKEIHVS